MIVTNTPLAMFLRSGSQQDPYVFIVEENRRITDGGTIVMQEFPINQVGYVATNNVVSEDPDPVAVEVFFNLDDGAGNLVETAFSEIVDPEAPLGELQFRVDYEFGLIHFNPFFYGKSEDITRNFVARITYAGRGSYYIAASRIYDDATYTNDLSQGELFQTLQDVLDNVNSINVNSTTTGAPGTDASVTVSGTSFDFVIPRGEPFQVKVEYLSIEDMKDNNDPIVRVPDIDPNGYQPEFADLAIIGGSTETVENAKLFFYDGLENTHTYVNTQGDTITVDTGGWRFISDLSGATGPTGPARAIEWKYETTNDLSDAFIIRWANDDNETWDESTEKNLALTPSWDGTELSITREEDSFVASYDLGITASWNDSELILTPNDGSTAVSQDLGLTPSWDGSELIITKNLDSSEVSYDVGITPEWSGNGTLTITPNDGIGDPVSYDLGWEATFDDTLLTFTPDNGSTPISVDLGITPSWTDTTLSITPNIDGSTPVEADLGLTPSWNNSELTITPNFSGSTGVTQDLGLTAFFTDDKLTVQSNILDEFNEPLFKEEVELGLSYSWDGTELTVQDKVGGPALSQELGVYSEWGDGIEESLTSLRFQNGDGSYTDFQELGLDAEWNGTELTVITPIGPLDPVDLQADPPTITASASSVPFNQSADVIVTEPTPNVFNLSFDIPMGEPLSINVTYETIADLETNTNPTPSGYVPKLFDLAVIQSPQGAENEDNAKLYICDDIILDEPVWVFISDLSGAKGDKGDTKNTRPMPNHQWVGTSLQFELPEGGYGDLVDLKGDKGDGAEDIDVVNTSELPNLELLNNQKEINEYLEQNKVNVSSLSSTLIVYPTTAESLVFDSVSQANFNLLVDSLTDPNYNTTSLDLLTEVNGVSTITGPNSLLASFIADKTLFVGNPGVIGITTIGNIKKVSDGTTSNAEFYFTLSVYDTISDVETLLATSGTTPSVTGSAYSQYFETALLNNGTFVDTDRFIIRYYGNKIRQDLNNPVYAFKFGGDDPVRTFIPVPVSVLPFDSKLDVAGGVMTGPLTILDSNTDVLFTTVNDGIEVTGPFSIKTGLFSVQDTNDNFLIDIADGFTSFYGDVQFGTSNALLATNSAQEIISYKSVELANLNSYVAGVRETNANNNLSFWKGTQAQYNNIPTKDPNTIYFVT